MKYFRCIMFFSLGCICAFAEDLTLPNGKSYLNYKVSRVEPDGISITHSTGITKLFFPELPPELQKQFNYDPTKARQYSQQVSEQRNLAAARSKYNSANAQALDSIKKSAKTLRGVVQQISDGGVLLQNARFLTPADDGVRPGFVRMPSNLKDVPGGYSVASPATSGGEPVYVVGGGGNYIDGERWESVVYPAGSYRYTTVMGAGKTVKCFALTPESALRYMMESP